MNKQEWQEWQAKAIAGTVQDKDNPVFLFCMTETQMLVDIVNGKINPVELAKRELESRRFDIKSGRFV
jgi:hypothetical protein